MSSDEVDKKNVDEDTQETASSAEENEEKDNAKEEKVNSKPAAKKKAADPPKIKQPAKKRVKTEQAEKETKKEDKKEEKKKVEVEEKEDEEEENDEEEEEEDSDVQNHKAVPLLDQPLEMSGSRKRKEVQRFKPTRPEEESKEVKIPEGKGKALGEIARVEFNIQRAKPEDLKLLHRLCFGKPGKAANVKKTIKKFNGFDFEEASDEYEKKKAFVEKSFKKVTVGHLKNICNIIDIEKSGTKDDILDRILSFLTCPVDSGKKLPGGGRSKRSGASSKNYDEGEESFKSKKKSKAKKKDEGSEESEDDEKNDSEEVKENNKKKESAPSTEESAPEEEEEKEKEKPKKGGKKGKKAAEVADKKTPPKKRAAAKKAAEKKSDSEGDADGDDESEDEEPLVKKAKNPPTDEEIKTYVKSLLEGANLELITMKKVCQDVYAHYPDFDLGHKKDFIKTTVKSLIAS